MLIVVITGWVTGDSYIVFVSANMFLKKLLKCILTTKIPFLDSLSPTFFLQLLKRTFQKENKKNIMF